MKLYGSLSPFQEKLVAQRGGCPKGPRFEEYKYSSLYTVKPSTAVAPPFQKKIVAQRVARQRGPMFGDQNSSLYTVKLLCLVYLPRSKKKLVSSEGGGCSKEVPCLEVQFSPLYSETSSRWSPLVPRKIGRLRGWPAPRIPCFQHSPSLYTVKLSSQLVASLFQENWSLRGGGCLKGYHV
ncbi:hypothetical protein AVEN_8230-1 [Araneus ventricosus]|uniref:Uncharacterized protein n=1 Tax=Araneus ventricosus TaxID=182803 RepID=A0A4Y2V7V0_ARAVE|nr:hypothetical protein AVEN_8230-1 [Araneus ventricosus]